MSALEISTELSHVCPKVIHIARKHKAKVFYTGPRENIVKETGTITEYVGPKSIQIKDILGNGETKQLDDIDVLILATGYQYDMKFIKPLLDWMWED